MAATEVIYFASDNLVLVRGLTDRVTGLVVNGATVTAQFLDSADAPIVGSDITLTSLTADGNYRGTMDDAVTGALDPTLTYKLEVIADNSGTKRRWSIPVTISENE